MLTQLPDPTSSIADMSNRITRVPDVDDPTPAPQGMVRTILDDRLFTWANVVTLSRLLLVPVFLWLLFTEENRAGAAIVLALMGVTDWVDGQIARRFNQVSELGKILDPAADRILLMISVMAILIDGALPGWVVYPILIREPIMFIAVPALALMGAKRIDVTWVGKAGTFLLMTSLPLLLLSADPSLDWSRIPEVLGYITAAGGICLSYYASFTYIPIAIQHLRDGRSERTAAGL